MKDIFDLIMPDKELDLPIDQDDGYVSEVKGQIQSMSEKLTAYEQEKKKSNQKLKEGILDYVRDQIAKIQPDIKEDVLGYIKEQVEKIHPVQIQKVIEKKIIEPKYIHVEPKVAPPQIIKETRVEVQVEKKDGKKYVEESKYLDLLAKISKMEKQLKETRRMAESPIVVGGAGGSGVIGIPPPEPNPDDHVLTVSGGKAIWKASTAAGGGSSSDAYTPTNVTTRTSFDANDTSLDEIADTLGSLIASLQGAGIIQ